jgi:hypothetical protein
VLNRVKLSILAAFFVQSTELFDVSDGAEIDRASRAGLPPPRPAGLGGGGVGEGVAVAFSVQLGVRCVTTREEAVWCAEFAVLFVCVSEQMPPPHPGPYFHSVSVLHCVCLSVWVWEGGGRL